jgi:PAS domain S-box-containing protein
MQPQSGTARDPARGLGFLPFTLFASTLIATVTAAIVTRDSLDVAARARLELVADDASERLKERLESAGSVARATAGLFVAQERVSSQTFHAFVGAQAVTRWLGEGRVAWVSAMRPGKEEEVLAQGKEEWAQYQFRSNAPHFPVLFVSPRSKTNEPLLGLDLSFDETRKAALERARDEGEMLLFGEFDFPLAGSGTAVLHPVYTGTPNSVEERRAQLRGVVLVVVPTEALLASAFEGSLNTFHVETRDLGTVAQRWRSPDFPPNVGAEEGVTRLVTFGGNKLAVHLVPRMSAETPVERYAFVSILTVGTILAFSFAGLTLQQLRGRRNAERAELTTRAAFDEADRRRALLDLVVDQSSDGIIMADGNGIVRLCNQAAASLYGVSREDVLNPSWKPKHLTADGEPLPENQTPLSRALQGEVVPESRWQVHRPDGEPRVLSGAASPLKNPDGTSAGAVLVMRDETERERLIVALEFSNAELEQFASVASHDLKAPLRGIAQLAQFLEEDLGDKLSAEDRQHLALLEGRVRRLSSLIDGILGYARAGQSSEALETFDAREAANEALVLLAPPPGSQVQLPAPGLKLHGDKALLLQVLMNLLSNAFMHGARGHARIEIDAQPDGSMVRFSVKDNGPGIDPQYHQRIWNMFQTLQPRDEKESTGIGLSVVRKVVQAQGGRAWVESALGEGATFFFTWPRQLKR